MTWREGFTTEKNRGSDFSAKKVVKSQNTDERSNLLHNRTPGTYENVYETVTCSSAILGLTPGNAEVGMKKKKASLGQERKASSL